MRTMVMETIRAVPYVRLTLSKLTSNRPDIVDCYEVTAHLGDDTQMVRGYGAFGDTGARLDTAKVAAMAVYKKMVDRIAWCDDCYRCKFPTDHTNGLCSFCDNAEKSG